MSVLLNEVYHSVTSVLFILTILFKLDLSIIIIQRPLAGGIRSGYSLRWWWLG